MVGVSRLLTPEMRTTLQKDCDQLRAQRRVNRLENIAVRTAEVTEAWQENGQDYVTVHFLASLLDYTTDESRTQMLDRLIGHGLKDPDTALESATRPTTVPPDRRSVLAWLGF